MFMFHNFSNIPQQKINNIKRLTAIAVGYEPFFNIAVTLDTHFQNFVMKLSKLSSAKAASLCLILNH